jgi:hypothetical protein
MVKDVYRDRKFVEKSRKFVCVVASIFKHEEPASVGQPRVRALRPDWLRAAQGLRDPGARRCSAAPTSSRRST